MDKGGSSENDAPSSKKKKGPRRSKKGNLIIDETHIIQPDEIPENSRFSSFGLGEFIEYIVKQFFNICLWIMRSYYSCLHLLDFSTCIVPICVSLKYAAQAINPMF
jgi:hypothetical protein